MNKIYDLVVIGAGPGGYHAAIRAAQLGLSVACIEKDDGSGNGGIGGVCLNWGCIPSKSLLKNAEIVNNIKNANEWGIEISSWNADISKAVERSRKVSKTLTQGISYLFKKNKIDLIAGEGKLSSSTEVVVDNKETITAKNIVIATGASPQSLPGFEIDGVSVLSARHALELKEKPEKIAIIGASAIGCEFAYYFNSYGSEVMLFELMNHLVPKEDEDISTELEKQFNSQGINFSTNTTITKLEKNNGKINLKYKNESEEKEYTCDKILLGVGVKPNSDNLGLREVGVILDNSNFITIDKNMKTNIPGVYAVGDVTGKLPLAHVAFDQGIVAAETIANHETNPIEDYSNMPRCTYCQPQIASIGITEKEAKEKNINYKIGKVPFQVAGKSVAIGEPLGFAKIIIDDDNGEIIGAHIIGPEATELIAEIGMVKFLEGTNFELHKMTHAHPTLSEAIKEAGAAVTGEAIHF